MFVDDTNLFLNHKELVNIKGWFATSKLSLNVEKAKYSFFHKPSRKDDISLWPPKLIISYCEI